MVCHMHSACIFFCNPHEIFEADQCRTEIQCPENPWLSKYRDATGVVTFVEGRRMDFKAAWCHLWHLVRKVNGEINFRNKRKGTFRNLVSFLLPNFCVPMYDNSRSTLIQYEIIIQIGIYKLIKNRPEFWIYNLVKNSNRIVLLPWIFEYY